MRQTAAGCRTLFLSLFLFSLLSVPKPGKWHTRRDGRDGARGGNIAAGLI